jgi:hypothetical protein
MTSTLAQAILALAGSAEEIPERAQRIVLEALLPTTTYAEAKLTWDDYQDVVTALTYRDQYDAGDMEFVDSMLECGNILGDDTAYLVDEDGTVGYDPAKAIVPESEAWNEKARKLAEDMAQRELNAHARTVVGQ